MRMGAGGALKGMVSQKPIATPPMADSTREATADTMLPTLSVWRPPLALRRALRVLTPLSLR